jgi:hypothetical protein
MGKDECTWENNIKMELREIEWEGMDWLPLAQDNGQLLATVNTVMHLQFHKRWEIF